MSDNWVAVTEGYEVSSTGYVRSVPRVIKRSDGRTRVIRGGVLKPSLDSNGYPYVNVGGKRVRVHRLVAQAFLGECPDGQVVCHRDGDPANNSVNNLYYGTYRENMLDIVRHGRNRNAEKTHCLRGHPLIGPNLRNRPGKGRECLACHRSWEAIKKEKL